MSSTGPGRSARPWLRLLGTFVGVRLVMGGFYPAEGKGAWTARPHPLPFLIGPVIGACFVRSRRTR